MLLMTKRHRVEDHLVESRHFYYRAWREGDLSPDLFLRFIHERPILWHVRGVSMHISKAKSQTQALGGLHYKAYAVPYCGASSLHYHAHVLKGC